MAYKNSAGSNLTKTELLALLTAQSAETIYKVNEDIYQSFSFDSAHFEGGSKLLLHKGQFVKSSDVDALFLPATIDSISPLTGLAAGGTPIIITGTNLSGAESGTLGAVALTSFVVVSNTRITAVTGAHTAGAVTAAVVDDSGTITKATAFTYV